MQRLAAIRDRDQPTNQRHHVTVNRITRLLSLCGCTKFYLAWVIPPLIGAVSTQQ